MAKPRKKGEFGKTQFARLFSAVSSAATKLETQLPTRENARGIAVSVEEYGNHNIDADALNQASESVETTLETELASVNPEATPLADRAEDDIGGFEGTSDPAATKAMDEHREEVSLEAARIMMLGGNNIKGYYDGYNENTKFKGGSNVRDNTMSLGGVYGTIPTIAVESRPSMESFDEKETANWRDYSYVINMLAAKSHDMIELFYRTYIATPDEAGFVIAVRRNMVTPGFRHKDKTGAAIKLADYQINMMEAMLDHKVLDTESTRLIPCLLDENKDLFVDPAVIQPQPAFQSGEAFETNFLKFDTTFSLIGIGQTPSRLQKGTPNWTDSLDHRIAIDKVAVKIGEKICVLDLNRTSKAAFVSNPEGHHRGMILDYRPDNIPLNEYVVALDKTGVPAELQALLDLGAEPRLRIRLNGSCNVFTGDTEVLTSSRAIEVDHLYNTLEGGEKLDMEDSRFKPLISALKLELIGWTPEARLTNMNQLELGLMIDSDERWEGFQIPTLYPFTIVKPSLTDTEKAFPKMEALTTAYRISLRNNGLTALLNRRLELRNILGVDREHKIESCLGMIEGPAQYYLRPYYLEGEIDLLKDLNSLKSSEKMMDIKALITGRLNEAAYRADMKSGYSSALEVCFPGSTPKPHLGIGTDKRLPQYLITQGDDRTFGIGMNHTVASISDLRMKNLIIMSFVLPQVKENHPLHFGLLAMIPEYLVNFDMIRGERITNEIRLTPRYRYFNYLPLMIYFVVKHLEEAVAMRTALDVNIVSTVDAGGTKPTEPGTDGDTGGAGKKD